MPQFISTDHVKINDLAAMEPAYTRIVSEAVKVHDGSKHPIRAVEFIAAPDLSAAGIPIAIKSLAMTVIGRGVPDERGALVPLSPSGAGRGNTRSAVDAVGRELMTANSIFTVAQAKGEAQRVIKHLMDIGCVTEEPVKVPKYKPDGSLNGSLERKGLVCHPELAPWVQPTDDRVTPASPTEAAV
ncbi:MAG TPA: hypothetical protein VGM07_17115 [Stellaceae bacterium]|jgi:hypothetical protein